MFRQVMCLSDARKTFPGGYPTMLVSARRHRIQFPVNVVVWNADVLLAELVWRTGTMQGDRVPACGTVVGCSYGLAFLECPLSPVIAVKTRGGWSFGLPQQ